jgi:hypothetical protein
MLLTKVFIILIGGNPKEEKIYFSCVFCLFSYWISLKTSVKDGTSTRRQQTNQINVESKDDDDNDDDNDNNNNNNISNSDNIKIWA